MEITKTITTTIITMSRASTTTAKTGTAISMTKITTATTNAIETIIIGKKE